MADGSNPFAALEQAMSQFEGFGTPGTIATRQNNPGDLIYGPFTQNRGAIGAGTNNIAIFPNTQTGASAMDQLIQQYAAQGYNIGQLIGAWAPGNAPGNTPQSQQNYTNFVTQQTGTTPNTPLGGLQTGGVLGNIWGGLLSGGNPGSIASGGAGGAVAGQQAQTALSQFSFSRIVAIAIGLIAIGGSVFLFKPTQEIIGRVGRGALAA